jgi:hypothetical protein
MELVLKEELQSEVDALALHMDNGVLDGGCRIKARDLWAYVHWTREAACLTG